MAATAQEIIRSLGGLTPEERAEIVRWCESFGTVSLDRREHPDVEHVYEKFAQRFAEYYRVQPLTLARLNRTRNEDYRLLVKATAYVSARVTAWWPNSQRNTRLALLRYLCGLCFDVCTRRYRRVSWRNLCEAMLQLEVTINDAFPGWLRAGVFQNCVIERISHGGATNSRELTSA